MSDKYILDKSDWYRDDILSLVGGKATNLIKLSKENYDVPNFVVITTRTFVDFISALQNDIAFFLSEIGKTLSVEECSERITNLIGANDIPKYILQKISSALDDFLSDDLFYAVRSSGIYEDSVYYSFAGQMDSFLFRKDKKSILNSIKKCWASAFSSRAIVYNKNIAIDYRGFSMGIIVQEMVFSDISGVAFTANPVSKNMNEVLITSTYGIGDGIVSGQLDTDEYVYNKTNESIKTKIVEKRDRCVFDADVGSGTTIREVGKEEQKKSSLDKETINRLSKIFVDIENLYGFPQDIEWALSKNNLFILQSRPISTINKTEYHEERTDYTIWDNSNIVESYCGVTTPLTYSFVELVYYRVYLQFCREINVSRKDIYKQDNNLRNMVGCINGNIYYNLKNWYRLIANLPFYKFNSKYMEEVMGVVDHVDFSALQEKQKNVSAFNKYFIIPPKRFYSGLSLLYRFLVIKRSIKSFTKRVDKYYNIYNVIDYSSLSCLQIHKIYTSIIDKVLKHWNAPIINDFLAMMSYGLLSTLLEKWKIKRENIQNDLLCGQGDVESTLPIKVLLEISEKIRNSNYLVRIFSNYDAKELENIILRRDEDDLNEEEKSIRSKIRDYLDKYGYRNMNELKLEEPTLKEDPRLLFTILRNYIGVSRSSMYIDEKKIREKAERFVKDKLKRRFTFLFVPKILVFFLVLTLARKAIKFREYQRFARSKMFGAVRNLFCSVGKKYYDLDLISDPDDIYFLTTEEIFSHIEGRSYSTSLKKIIIQRKKEYEKYKTEEIDRRIDTRGVPYRKSLISNRSVTETDEQKTKINVLKGTSCCPGSVRGTAKVIRSPSDNMSLKGEILVAGKTDPGWIILYPAVSGLLIERGSVLSHSAIVAREMGLPTIVGIPSLLEAVKTGDELEFDGASGIIKILKRINVDSGRIDL